MKIEEILFNIPKGGVVTDGRVLSVLKRLGHIFGYSRWGYLESQNVHFFDSFYHENNHCFTYNGPQIKDGDVGSHYKPFKNSDELRDRFGFNRLIGFTYKGFKFGYKYLDGCFNAYLVKEDGPTRDDKTATPRMCLWGQII